uniref:presenilins-associated rhomboid-like protein, mitochondrial n=1 Tax=Styela clava TaxID=7725 RepID=UPI0019395850|nr:presenilins-associated rhomboid-like protein, mitochondrial [Styela clava]
MIRWFTLSLANTSNQFAAMILSMFSHKSFIHFYLNMYVLSSFCMAWNQLSKSRSQKSGVNSHERYFAFYLTAGMCSSLLSIMVKNIGRIPHPSLGASGAIMGLIGYTCEKMPNNLLSIVFLPNFTFSADSAKNFIIGFDTVGLLIGAFSKWRYMIFDHAGHLGGMLFGIWYAKYGEEAFDNWCRKVMEYWGKK